MASSARVRDLEINQDVTFNRREWTVQRVGWVLMALVILAALLGLTGSGVFARATAGDAGAPIRMEYSRFDRLEAPSSLNFRFTADAVRDGQIEFWIERGYAGSVQVEKIVPEPQEVRIGPDRIIYVFAVEDAGQPLDVTFDMRHTSFGWKSSRVGLVDGPALEFRQFVYP